MAQKEGSGVAAGARIDTGLRYQVGYTGIWGGLGSCFTRLGLSLRLDPFGKLKLELASYGDTGYP